MTDIIVPENWYFNFAFFLKVGDFLDDNFDTFDANDIIWEC